MVSLSSETPFCRSAGSGGSHKPLALLKLAQPLAYPQRAFINRNVATWRKAVIGSQVRAMVRLPSSLRKPYVSEKTPNRPLACSGILRRRFIECAVAHEIDNQGRREPLVTFGAVFRLL